MERTATFLALVLSVAAGCGNTVEGVRRTQSGDDGGVLTGSGGSAADAGTPATSTGGNAADCHWPESLVPAGTAANGACSVARHFVSCGPENGVSSICLSDDPASCSGPNAIPHCTDECAADEYAVSCGGPPIFEADGSVHEPAHVEPPPGCRSMGGTPGGNVFYCCPCE